LKSIGDPELLTRFENISGGDPLVIISEALDNPDAKLCDALVKVLEGENDLGIVINILDNMRGRMDGFIAAVATFIGRLSERTPGLKAFLTIGSTDNSGATLEGMPCIKVQYDKERRGLNALYIDTTMSNVANKCRVP
jgi:hypothetical protein